MFKFRAVYEIIIKFIAAGGIKSIWILCEIEFRSQCIVEKYPIAV